MSDSTAPGPFADRLVDTDTPPDDVPETDARRLVERNVTLLRDAGGTDRAVSVRCPACGEAHIVRCSPPPADTFEAGCCECGATLVPITALVTPYDLGDYSLPPGIDLDNYDLSAYAAGMGNRENYAEGYAISRIVTHPARLLDYYDDLRPFEETWHPGEPDGPRGPETARIPVEIQLGRSDRLDLEPVLGDSTDDRTE